MYQKMGLGLLVALPLGIAGLLFASTPSAEADKGEMAEASYVCPITGDLLPCPKCCPINNK